jgi:hypothetical protein
VLIVAASGWLQRLPGANVRQPEAWDKHVYKTWMTCQIMDL